MLTIQVVLVNPPYPPACYQHPPSLPLGLAYLGAVLMEGGVEVNVLDAQILRLDNRQIEDRIAEIKPDIVGVTSTTLTYKSALEVAKIAKGACPKCITVVGGCHVTFWDKNALQESPSLDIVVRREGERTFLELTKKIERREHFGDVLGITYRDSNGRIHRNPDRPYIEDLDGLPYPAYDLFPLEKYKVHRRVQYPIQMSRGCTFNCNYCSTVRMHGGIFRVREPRKVVDEIEILNKKYGANYFFFVDDNFTLNPTKTKVFLDELRKRRVRIDWDCQGRVDVTSKGLWSDMRKSGCQLVLFGVESGCKKMLEAMGKQASLEQARTAFKLGREAGLLRIASIIFGFPGETRGTIEETIKFVHELDPDGILYNIATPYPGTLLYEHVTKMGWPKVTDWNRYDCYTPVFETPQLKINELQEIRENAYRKFYLRPGHVLRMLLKGNAFGYSEVKISFTLLLRSLGLRL